MNTIIVKANNKVTKALVTILEAFGVSFEVKMEGQAEDGPYDPKFVSKIMARSESAKQGNTVEYTDALKKELFQ